MSGFSFSLTDSSRRQSRRSTSRPATESVGPQSPFSARFVITHRMLSSPTPAFLRPTSIRVSSPSPTVAATRSTVPFRSVASGATFQPSSSFFIVHPASQSSSNIFMCFDRSLRMAATPNQALQRTAPAVTLAASGLRLSPTMQPARQPPPSLSLGSLGNKHMTRLIFTFSVLLLVCATGIGSDFQQEIDAINRELEAIRMRIVPANGTTKEDVLTRFGLPDGATTTQREAEHGKYDEDGLGVYRWFYRHNVRAREAKTGLTTSMPVELAIYFVEGRVAATSIELSQPIPRGYLSNTGFKTTTSGRPPTLRRAPEGGFTLDYHVPEGELDYRRKLLAGLQRYEQMLQETKKKGPSNTT